MTAEIINFPIKGISRLEKCLSCGEQTNIKRDESIDLRPNYIEGVGQFCGPCYRENMIKTKGFAKALDEGRYE